MTMKAGMRDERVFDFEPFDKANLVFSQLWALWLHGSITYSLIESVFCILTENTSKFNLYSCLYACWYA